MCATQESGYLTKQILAACQTEVLDVHGSDCKTQKTLDILITNKNANELSYRYIVEGDKYVNLDTETIPKYIGKVVKLRSPMYCTGDRICNICAGEMNYKLENLNIGLGCSKISTTLTRLGMKKFHISTMKSSQINVDDMLI